MLQTIARKFWAIIKWFWLALLIGLVVSLTANVLVVKRSEFSETILSTILHFIFTPSLWQASILLVTGLLIALTISAWIILTREERSTTDRVIRHYLRTVIETNQGLNPSGFAQQSQALISVNVPLDEIFIHLHAIPDRPIYDVPSEQQKLLEELRQRTDLSIEEREELIQRLRVIWYSQIGQESAAKRQKSDIPIEDVLLQLNATDPVAVILGTPGSGKSTTLRWLALHMARTALSPNYCFPPEGDDDYYVDDDDLYNEDIRRTPILLRISDYAKQLSKAGDLSFNQFFTNYIAETHPNLPGLSNGLLAEMAKGHCLVLLDGLDEVASDDLRRRVAQAIDKFIVAYTKVKQDTHNWNVFIITSRIVGYESGTFAKHAHYTLLDFEDEQIEQFLTKWCPAVERYQAMFSQGMKPLTSQQETQMKRLGVEQRDHLLSALTNNSSIKRLAVNPLMLTILALIQRSGKTLPHRRVELYQIVTRTLLDNWNKGSERRVFPIEEVPLAEQLLGNLAYQLHSTDPILTEQEVKAIAHQTMIDFYGHTHEQIRDSDIKQFIETLRSSSGLFIESGQGLFNFMHRTFQEYFVALYLLRKTSEELKQFAIDHYHSAIWHEPLLLATAYKSGQSSRTGKQEASDLIQAIKDASDDYDRVLHHSLLFAANSVVDCSAWSIDKQIQYDIANSLFDLYGDMFGDGHYTRLKREIEKVSLFWLRGQPQESSQKNALPPLLAVWNSALRITNHTMRQEGAVHLLAELAPQLSSCPEAVLLAIFPSLLQLADLLDLPHPPEIHVQLSQPLHVIPLGVAYYAWETLRLLEPLGPMKWLEDAWNKWHGSRSELVAQLDNHIQELNIPLDQIDTRCKYLLSKLTECEALEPSKGQAWQKIWHTFLREEMARGRYATYQLCLGLRLLLCEDDEQERQALADELMDVLSTHDQQQLQLLLIFIIIYLRKLEDEKKEDEEEEGEGNWNEYDFVDPDIGYEDPLDRRVGIPRTRPIRVGASSFVNGRKQKVTTRIFGWSMRLLKLTDHKSDLLSVQLQRPPIARAWRPEKVRPIRSRVALGVSPLPQRRRSPSQSPRKRPTLAQRLRRIKRSSRRALRDLRENLPQWIPFSLQNRGDNAVRTEFLSGFTYDESPFALPSPLTEHQQIWRVTLALQEMEHWLQALEKSNVLTVQDIQELQNILNTDTIVNILSSLLKQPANTSSSTELLVLHIILATYRYISPSLKEQVRDCIQTCEKCIQPLTTEHRFLLDTLSRRLEDPIEQYESPDARASALLSLKQQQELTKLEVERILMSCIDTRRLITHKFPTNNDTYYSSSYNAVYDVAWGILTQQFSLNPEAQTLVVQALDDDKAMICATAALLLQNSRTLLPDTRKDATQKILRILSDNALSRRQLDAPDKRDWRLDNVLFETLQALAELDR